ncbi:MAG: histidine kinase [Rhodoferax sp.]|jgi:two-component system sensor histidine kinase PhoQ|nr:histidine kinase [Rhodoferax sp.]HQX60147.1 ATP-binding protein [Burkholderiaceae bacterium]HQZ07176.1 ATP-binding protein [Burkholderiaceae bacterium]
MQNLTPTPLASRPASSPLQRILGRSIRVRLILGATLVLTAFVAVAGWAVQRAHTDSVRAAHFAQLQSTVYLLLAGAEVDADGALVMPPSFPEPRLSLPGSGLYASVHNSGRDTAWRSASTVNLSPPFLRDIPVGEWRFDSPAANGRDYLAVAYGVRWAVGTRTVVLELSVLEDGAGFRREVSAFARTLWAWLGGAGLLLLLSQAVLLQWGLSPLRRVAGEVRRIERGEQIEIEQHYPSEIAALTDNLNALIRQERVRQTRFKEALSFLAHSLKTPLSVLRGAMDEPDQLRATVAEQVRRMDDIVQHQLGRAGASGTARFVPYLRLAPILARVRDALVKVHAGKALTFTLDCPQDLQWRIDEGDAFEMLGNLMDNASKWARQHVAVQVSRHAQGLTVRIDDDGPGFPENPESVLQLHVRGDEQVPGHGVGLAVVNDLVTSHQGILVLTRSPWGGARVEILLPAR